MPDAWYVARIKTTVSWDTVISNLWRQGFSSYLPIISSERYFAGKKTIIEQPLFPTYIFVALDVDIMRWRAVNSTVGILHLLPANREQPLSVPTAFVEELKTRKTAEKMVETARSFVEHELVRFISGPFLDPAHNAARVLTSGANSTRVVMAALGREVVVSVSNGSLISG
jgi:transcriptional antiterminator RfaH